MYFSTLFSAKSRASCSERSNSSESLSNSIAAPVRFLTNRNENLHSISSGFRAVRHPVDPDTVLSRLRSRLSPIGRFRLSTLVQPPLHIQHGAADGMRCADNRPEIRHGQDRFGSLKIKGKILLARDLALLGNM